MPFLLLFALFFHLRYALCWGDLGHRTTAYLAAHYLTPAEQKQLQGLTGFDDISDAAVWADHEGHFRYSSRWHYLNVHDNPPADCSIVLSRDHTEGAADILTAFMNHTSIATDEDSTPNQLREAYRFLIHWIGDIHQPLHAEGEALGGNQIPVKFDGVATNLHTVWDVHIPGKLRNARDDDREAAKSWAADLYEQHPNPNNSLPEKCHSLEEPLMCILVWATESNGLVCQAVLKDGAGSVWRQELGGPYYEAANPIVEARVATAGQRMAVWLRALLKATNTRTDLYEDVLQQPLVVG